MLPSLTSKTLRDSRRGMIGWIAGIGLFTLFYTANFSSFQGKSEEAADAADRIPDGVASVMGGVGDISTGAGYLQTVVFQLFLPLLVICAAVMWGNRAVAHPEESGSIDLLLSIPISRRRFIAERFLAMAIGVVAACTVVWLAVLAMNANLDMGVGFAEITATVLGLILVSLAFGTFALAVSAFVGRKSIVLSVTGVVALGTYLLRSYSVDHEAVRPLRWISPFQYYLGNNPLQNGFHAGYVLVLVLFVAVLALVAVTAFDRRDVGT
ncbi:ABC transporter permease [Streptomyces sp. NBC_00280]|uniref:ABC transporter permease n=1 Tax=Streptomyces sp. NBC_00280 TaxID=2975699 RepID=UPI00324375BB